MKKLIAILLTTTLAFALIGCSESKILHCDSCGTEVKVKGDDTVMEEDWIIFCEKCNAELMSELKETYAK